MQLSFFVTDLCADFDMLLGNAYAFLNVHQVVLEFANCIVTVTPNRDGKLYKLVAARTEK